MTDSDDRIGDDIAGFRADHSRRRWYPYRSVVDAEQWTLAVQARADRTIEEWVWEYTSGLPRHSATAWDEVESFQAPRAYFQAWRFLDPVLETYDRTRRFEYLEFAVQVALNWSRQQPPIGREPPSRWYDAIVGLRAHPLAYLTDAAARRAEIPDETVARLVALSREHVDVLMDANRHPARADHAALVAVGQYVLARRLDALPSMVAAERNARERLRRTIGASAAAGTEQTVAGRVLRGLVEDGLAEGTEIAATATAFEQASGADRPRETEAPVSRPGGTMSLADHGGGSGQAGMGRNDGMARASLIQIGRKHKADKLNHGYLPHYDDLLEPLRDAEFEMLEIGVHEGGSIRMWHEYFTAARIIGVDSKPIVLEDDLPRYTFIQGSQADWAFLTRLRNEHAFRVIVDDGSHVWGHQIFTFQTLFPALEPGGIYVCEDIQTSYGELAERYHGGAAESAADYFFRVARAVAAGGHQEFQQAEDPLMHYILRKIRSMTFIRHGVIIVA